jgi:hypothetical protein
MPQPPEPYANRFPERCQQFLDCQATRSTDILRRTDPHCSPGSFTLPTFRHELYHDAESIFWVMFYWVLLVKPAASATDSMADSRVPFLTWAEMQTSEGKDCIIGRAHRFLAKNLHPSYSGLAPLIASLLKYLKVDPFWFDPRSSRSHPEFVHECFQREILKFLVENIDKPFMICKKSKTSRAIPGGSTTPSLSTTPIPSQIALPNPDPDPLATATGVATLFNPSSHATNFVLGPRARSSSTNIEDDVSSFHPSNLARALLTQLFYRFFQRIVKRGRFDKIHGLAASGTD